MNHKVNRGRPRIENKKDKNFHCRIGIQEQDMLEYLMKETGMTRTDIFNKGLKMLFNLEKYHTNH